MDPNVVSLIAELGTGTALIGMMIALYVRLDTKIDSVRKDLNGVKGDLNTKIEGEVGKLDGKIDNVGDKLDGKIDGVARDVVEVKVSVARIEGHLEARDSFTPARPASTRPGGEAEEVAAGYRRTG